MRVAWLADAYEVPGGAELTEAELRAAAPADVELVRVAPEALDALAGCDVACLHNTATYPPETLDALSGTPAVRYWHDLAFDDGPLTRWAAAHATPVFTSPLHRARFRLPVAGDAHVVPPPIDLERFEDGGGSRPRGACWLGSGRHPGKGLVLAREWAEANEPVDFWGEVALEESPRVRVKGHVPHAHVPTILRMYRRFVFLPTHTEPFGRAVVEAWAAGCQLVVNRNVGALHFLEHPAALERAAADFWRLVARCAS
jgi:glycosyltransferase involved in cell wall biosynthesis